MNKVIVTADSMGAVIGVSQNSPEYGYVRVEQTTPIVNEQGWLSIQKRSALIKGKVEDLQATGFYAGQVLPGRIVVKESHTPFNTVTPERDLKIAGDTGVVCRVDDQPIYRQSFYTAQLDASDELIQHNNQDEIREVQASQKALQKIANTSTVTVPQL